MLGGVWLIPMWYFVYSKDTNTLMIDDDNSRKPEKDLPWFHRPLTGLFTFVACLLYMVALLFLSASILQILKGFEVIILPFYSYFVFGTVLKLHEVLGILLVLFGLLAASLTELATSEIVLLTSTGIILSCLAGFSDAAHIVCNEWAIKRHNIHPVKQVMAIMLYTLLFTTIALLIFSLIPCEETSPICINGHLEDPILAVREIFNNSTLLCTTLFLFIGMLVECIFGTMALKLDSGVSNITITQVKALLIWIFFLFY
mmetsp:Transcript_9584/g.7282  ORF Transcript_9584/g.7282 Transcript_9584/m.7282 type:complete len:258 (+) Transcript_9584:164-937(+)